MNAPSPEEEAKADDETNALRASAQFQNRPNPRDREKAREILNVRKQAIDFK